MVGGIAADTTPRPSGTLRYSAMSPFALVFLLAAAGPAPVETNAKGFDAPSLHGYQKLPWPDSGTTDASPALPGADTLVETFRDKKGNKILRLSTPVKDGFVWAYGVLPGGDATKGYFLRDPDCSKKLTEKWSPDAALSAPACAALPRK